MHSVAHLDWTKYNAKKAWPTFDGPCENTFTNPPTPMDMRFSKSLYQGRVLKFLLHGKVVKGVTDDEQFGSGFSFQFKPVSTDLPGLETYETILDGPEGPRLCAQIGFTDFFEEYTTRMMLGDTSQLRIKLKEKDGVLEFSSNLTGDVTDHIDKLEINTPVTLEVIGGYYFNEKEKTKGAYLKLTNLDYDSEASTIERSATTKRPVKRNIGVSKKKDE
jgi:hypothetical protein